MSTTEPLADDTLATQSDSLPTSALAPVPTPLVTRSSVSAADLDALFALDDDEDEADDDRIDGAADTFGLTLHTIDAQTLWTGRPRTAERYGTPGAQHFCRRVGFAIRGVRADDPYAYMALSRIEGQIGVIYRRADRLLRELDELMNIASKFGVRYNGPDLSRYEPRLFPFTPRNSYAHAMITLVGMYDQVALRSLDARNVGRINSEQLRSNKQRRPYSRLIRTLVEYKASGSTREDFAAGAAPAARAVEKYGPPDSTVLDG